MFLADHTKGHIVDLVYVICRPERLFVATRLTRSWYDAHCSSHGPESLTVIRLRTMFAGVTMESK